MLAREEAFVLLVPGVVCSERMVLPCAMQALEEVSMDVVLSLERGELAY